MYFQKKPKTDKGCDGFQIHIRIRQNPALFPKSVGYLKPDRNGFEIFVGSTVRGGCLIWNFRRL